MSAEVSVRDLTAALRAGEPLVDVRERIEFAQGHVPGAIWMPLGRLASELDRVPGGRVHVICASGNRSRVAADFLSRSGRDAVSVAGGTAAWSRAGGALATGHGG